MTIRPSIEKVVVVEKKKMKVQQKKEERRNMFNHIVIGGVNLLDAITFALTGRWLDGFWYLVA